jgi:hypothetical protein
MEEAKPDGLIAGSYTISLDIAGRRIQIGGYIQQGESKAETIRKMDEAQECIDHQMIRADLKSQEGHLKGELAQLENLLDEHEKLLAKKDASPRVRLHPQEEAKLRNFTPTSDQLRTQIAYRKKIIAENRKVLGLNGEAPA